MINTLLGIKKQMTSTYDARGRRVGATVVEITPNLVTQVKTSDSKDGYNAIQLGFGTRKSVKKPQIGHLKKAGIEQKVHFLKEVRIKNQELSLEEKDLGKEIKVGDVFAKGDAVKVTGVSKGRGFQGGVRRHGFHGGPKTHGQSDRHRAPGSIGAGTTPGRVYKGKRMAGHMGAATASIRNLEVIGIDKTNNQIIIKGGIPGHSGALLQITRLGRIKGYTPPPEEKPEDEEDGDKGQVESIKGEEQENKEDKKESVEEEKGKSSSAEAMEDKQNA